ncbi:MAG: epoxide hydrolase, partial [Gemmatimonadaceae bacterium]|nr:epoxide hydrolase [Gemmatimonadaceae bacterium]
LADLRERVARTRWPNTHGAAPWEDGTDQGYLRELCAYWTDGFDWRAIEERLNTLPQFRTTIDGVDVHYVYRRGVGPRPLPIVITHGWPSTFVEMERLGALLADPAAHGGDPRDAFDVVVPSVPGFGFSSPLRGRSITNDDVVRLWSQLMTRVLGYERFVAHGGDLGASITARLGALEAARVPAIHVTSVTGSSLVRYLGPDAPALTDAERRFVQESDAWWEAEGGYAHVHRTKPQTLAHALSDSPVGLAAWLVEKFRTWSDCDGDVERRFSKDDLLTTITIYWATETISSSFRLYTETRRAPWRFARGERIAAPAGVAIFPRDIARPPREWGARIFDVRRWTEMPRGGHFAAHEEPELLAAELREFFRPFRA